MEKKTGQVSSIAASEELIAVNNAAENDLTVDSHAVPVVPPQVQAQVTSIIHEWLTDMWLLTTGEELSEDFISGKKHNGRPLAIVCDGQMRLMESRLFTLDALRTVGIEMS